MTRRAAIAALVAFSAFAQARGEWVTEVVTNRVEYDGVEYLQSSGTQYIKTGIIPYNSIAIELDFKIVSWVTAHDVVLGCDGGGGWWYGSRRGASSSTFAFLVNSSGPSITATLNSLYKLKVANQSVYLNGSKIGTVGSGSSTSNQLAIFGDGAGSSAAWLGSFIVYRCKISGSRNLIPVLDGTTPKMLNLVDGQLYANAGSGSFAYGSITGKVAYVTITTNRVYRAPAPMRSYDAAHPFNNAAARTRLGGTGNGEDGTTLRPTAHIAIKRNEED